MVENVCNLLLFQVQDLYDSITIEQTNTNVRRSIEKQADLVDVVKKMVTTPTICSAASNFLVIFANIATIVMILQGKD